ncbi:MAG TPA: hypothetical protein VMV82_06605 [Candidatus Dormibacteraeota bacterium]|nr:hypothetical protein [Candidatus Dormibacteraeota bacterium]
MTGSEEIPARVRRLAEFLVANDLQSVRIERENEHFEVRRAVAQRGLVLPVPEAKPVVTARVDQIAADRVGIFHLSRPAPFVGEVLDGDRELGYVEQLGIRNPIRSRGAGRIASILQGDGDLVDYGRPLFELERA